MEKSTWKPLVRIAKSGMKSRMQAYMSAHKASCHGRSLQERIRNSCHLLSQPWFRYTDIFMVALETIFSKRSRRFKVEAEFKLRTEGLSCNMESWVVTHSCWAHQLKGFTIDSFSTSNPASGQPGLGRGQWRSWCTNVDSPRHIFWQQQRYADEFPSKHIFRCASLQQRQWEGGRKWRSP